VETFAQFIEKTKKEYLGTKGLIFDEILREKNGVS
jgi:hypothetical protein